MPLGAGDGSKINSSVFARQPESFETGALRLQRVAAWGPDAACSVGAFSCQLGAAGLPRVNARVRCLSRVVVMPRPLTVGSCR